MPIRTGNVIHQGWLVDKYISGNSGIYFTQTKYTMIETHSSEHFVQLNILCEVLSNR